MIVTITADDGTHYARFDVTLPAIPPGERGRKVIAAMSATGTATARTMIVTITADSGRKISKAMSATGTAVGAVEQDTNIIDVLLDAACWDADRAARSVRRRLRREIDDRRRLEEGNHS